MMNFSKLSGSVRLRGRLEHSLRNTISGLGSLFRFAGENSEEAAARRTLLALVKSILQSRGPLSEGDLDTLRRILSADHSPFEVEHFVTELRSLHPIPVEEAAPVFLPLPRLEREKILRMLLALAADSTGLDANHALIYGLGQRLEFTPEELDALTEDVVAQRVRRQKIIRSGAGILVAVIVVAVFILTATLLRSVIFGLIAAYLLLPVEKFFERRLRARKGLGYLFFRLTGWLARPLHSISRRISRKAHDAPEEDAESVQLKAERKLITQAVSMTTGVLVLALLALLLVFSSVTHHYVLNLTNSVKGWTERTFTDPPPEPAVPPVAAPASAPVASPPADSSRQLGFTPSPRETQLAETGAQRLLSQGQLYLEQLRVRFENLPLVRFGLDQISKLLNDESAQRELAGMLLKRTGGIFSFTAGVLGMIGAILADLLLTVFFFLLFLTKLAEFCEKGSSADKQSEYLVRTVFNGNWLPDADEDTIAEAQRIIGGMLLKLRVWVRGYLTLMLVDATVYTTAFFFLGVPYFPILGMLAGCGILLPYIGPILSAMLTVLVTLAVGGSSATGAQLAAIIAVYLIYNGVIEQFILYPAVIGESLGLTTLETIIVVLLGAIFAGIPGMILAIPASSIIKYLVPQIYNCFGELRRAPSSGKDRIHG